MTCWIRLLALAMASLISPSVFAQAWIHEPGSGYAEVGGRHLSGSAFYNGDGESRDIASRYSQSTLTVYGEVGVVERWLQLSAGGELYRRNALAEQGATRGLGDLQVGAFTGLLQGEVLNLSAGLRVGLPTGDADPTSGTGDPQLDIIAASLPTGAGEFSLTPTIAVGLAFGGGAWPLRHYLSTSLGYLVWFGFSDSLTWSAELGTRINVDLVDRLTLRLRLAGLDPLSAPQIASFSGVGEGVTYTSFGIGLAVDIWRGLGVHAMFESAFRARNIIAATPYSVGLFWRF